MLAFLRWLFGLGGSSRVDRVRDRGRPPSPNGASSFHLYWQGAPRVVAAVRVTVEVVAPPATTDLYFFALQASFLDRGQEVGGGHVGIQWNRRHPGNTAVNWGGYRAQRLGGDELPGTESTLPSQPNDPNTRDYPWEAGRRYRLTIDAGADVGWWRGSIEDVASGAVAVIRELEGGGDGLGTPLVWTEVFAACDAPPVTIRWSELEFATVAGEWHRVTAVDTNYQDYNAGGCSNTDSASSGGGFTQTTNVARVNSGGVTLQLPS